MLERCMRGAECHPHTCMPVSSLRRSRQGCRPSPPLIATVPIAHGDFLHQEGGPHRVGQCARERSAETAEGQGPCHPGSAKQICLPTASGVAEALPARTDSLKLSEWSNGLGTREPWVREGSGEPLPCFLIFRRLPRLCRRLCTGPACAANVAPVASTSRGLTAQDKRAASSCLLRIGQETSYLQGELSVGASRQRRDTRVTQL